MSPPAFTPLRRAFSRSPRDPPWAGRRPDPRALKQGRAQSPPHARPRPSSRKTRPQWRGRTKLPRSLWGLFWGHHILTIFGINFHMLSQPFLVMSTLGKGKALMGVVRNIHMGSMSFVNLLPVGLLIDKTDFRILFVVTSLARALLMGAIPLLFLGGHLTFGVLLAIVALNPLFQSTMIVADSAARKAFLGKDEKLNKEATATLSKWDSVAGMIFPLAAGWAIGALVTSFGLGGYAIAYGVYSVLLLASIPIYWFMVRDPRDPAELGWAGFKGFLKGTAKFVGDILTGIILGIPKVLWWAAAGLARIIGRGPMAAVHAFMGLFSFNTLRQAKAAAPAAGFKERLAQFFDKYEAMQGISYILRNKTLSLLMLVGAIEAFLADAMPMVVLPNFITDAIGEAPVGPHLLAPLLATAGGIFGIMMAAEYLGRFLSSWRMEGDKGDKLIARWGHGRFYRIAAVASLSFWFMWLFPALLAPGMFWVNLGVVMAVQFVLQLAHAPVGIVMAPVVRKEIPDKILGRVDSAFNMVDLFFSAGGALLAGIVLDFLNINTAMLIIAIAITGTAILEWMVPKWIFPDGKRPAKTPAPGPETGGPTAWRSSAIPVYA